MQVDIIIQNDSGQWVTLDAKDVDIVMSKTFENLEDPSSIDAAYTLDVQLPYNKHNNTVLGELYRLDFTRTGNNELDQRKKYPCKVMHNQSIIYQGNFVLNTANLNYTDASANYYTCTIYDEMYDLFKKLDYTIAEPHDSLDSGTPKNVNIDSLNVSLTAQLVKDTCDYETRASDIMQYTTGGVCTYQLKQFTTNAGACEAIGFFPVLRDTDLPKDEMICTNAAGTALIADETKIDDILPNNPCTEYNEYSFQTWKAYHCKPYMYYSAYIDFIAAEIYRTTGYKLDRTTKFFNPANPFYSELIRTCNYIEGAADDSESGWVEVSTMAHTKSYLKSNDRHTKTGNVGLGGNVDAEININETIDTSATYRLVIDADVSTLLKADDITDLEKMRPRYNRYQTLKCDIAYVGLNHINQSTVWSHAAEDAFYCYSSDRFSSRSTSNDGVAMEFLTTNVNSSDMYYDYTNNYPAANSCYYALPTDSSTPSRFFFFDNNGELRVSSDRQQSYDTRYAKCVDCNIFPDGYHFTHIVELTPQDLQAMFNGTCDRLRYNINGSLEYQNHDYYEPTSDFNSIAILLSNINFRLEKFTQPTINYKKLLGEDFNILQSLVNVAKTFNLVVDVDYNEKKIYLFERGEYFTTNRDNRQGIIVDDWSDNINLKETLEHTSIISDYRNIVYDYEERETENNLLSRQKANITAGSHTYDLNLPVNNEDKRYLEGMYNSYIGYPSAYWLYDYAYTQIRAKHPLDKTYPIYIDNDKDGNALDNVSGQLLFRKRNRSYEDFQAPLVSSPIWIVDDTTYEKNNDEYFIPYCTNKSQYTYGEVLTEYPMIDVVNENGTYCSEWTTNMGAEPQLPTARGIYDVFHKPWMDVVYGYPDDYIVGHKLTAYFHIPLSQYAEWDFSHFVRIDNNVYIVLSIDEYSFGNGIMKATLIQIRDLNIFEDMDLQLPQNYLYIIPNLSILPKATQPNTVQYRIKASSSALTLSNLVSPLNPAELPDKWLNSISHTITPVTTTNGYSATVNVTYTTNGNYDTYAAAADKGEGEAHNWNFTAYTGITNGEGWRIRTTKEPLPLTDTITVTPQLVQVDNDTQHSRCIFTVTTMYNLVTVTPVTTGNTVVTSFTHSNRDNSDGTYTVSCNYQNTTGQAGQRQAVTFTNAIGNSTTANFERLEAPFEHIEHFMPRMSNGLGFDYPYSWGKMIWDFTSVNDPFYSEYYWDFDANYDFSINHWDKTMYDNAANEYCYDNKLGIPELWDITNPNNPVRYDIRQAPFLGDRNTLYHFKWIYPRRKGQNKSSVDTYYEIRCVGGHNNGEPHVKLIKVIADNLNNQP